MDCSFGAVVFRVGTEIEYLLVLHTSGGHWDSPKGHPEGEETPKETARREILEETGYQVDFVQDFEEKIEYRLPNGTPKQVVFFLAKCQGKSAAISTADEVADIRWYNYEDAKEQITYANSKEVLEKAHHFLKSLSLGV